MSRIFSHLVDTSTARHPGSKDGNDQAPSYAKSSICSGRLGALVRKEKSDVAVGCARVPLTTRNMAHTGQCDPYPILSFLLLFHLIGSHITITSIGKMPALTTGTSPLPNTSAPKKERYFTPNEVETHNYEDDCWLSLLGKVFDVTSLVRQHKSNPTSFSLSSCLIF